MSRSKQLNINVPGWTTGLYTLLALILIPWTIFLGEKLPSRHLSQHWDVAWVGLDVAVIISLFLTGITARLKSKWVTICATTTATLLVVDAWFDTVTARAGIQLREAVILAIFVELPLAAASYWLAHTTVSNHL